MLVWVDDLRLHLRLSKLIRSGSFGSRFLSGCFSVYLCTHKKTILSCDQKYIGESSHATSLGVGAEVRAEGNRNESHIGSQRTSILHSDASSREPDNAALAYTRRRRNILIPSTGWSCLGQVSTTVLSCIQFCSTHMSFAARTVKHSTEANVNLRQVRSSCTLPLRAGSTRNCFSQIFPARPTTRKKA